tara:strand:- start:166 stop:405 length:240 start_codon:yes stop_codon:yes gene_type:complete
MLDKKQWATGVSITLSVGAIVWICSTLVDLDKRTAIIAIKVEESNKQIKKNQKYINLVLKNIMNENNITWDYSGDKYAK